MDSFRLIRALAVATAVAIVGCSTIIDARDAQESVAAKSADDAALPEDGDVRLHGYTLEDLVGYALTNRPSMVSAKLAVDDARLAMKEVAADAPVLSDTPWTSPKVSLSGSYSESSNGSKLEDADWHLNGDSSAAVSLDLLIWDFGRNDARKAAQAERTVAAELELVNEGYAVFADVANAYFTLLEKGALLEVACTNEYEYSVHLDRAERRSENGEAKRLDVLKARLDYASAREKTINASNDVVTAGAEFLRSLGVDASNGSRRDVIDFEGNALTFAMRGFPESDYDVAGAFDFARTNSPTMKIVRAKLRAASANVDYAIADLMPSVSVSGSFSWTDPLWFFKWGASGVQSIFQGFRKTTAVDRAVVAMEQAAADVDRAEQQLSLDLELAIAARDNAREARRTASDALKQAKENLEMVKRQFDVGEASRVDFTSAVASCIKELGNRIGAFYQGQRAEAAIFALVGRYPVYEEKVLTEEDE